MNARSAALHELWREQPGLFRGYVVDLVTALGLGTILAVGGRQHTQATAWDVVNDNGGPVCWGLVLIGLGLLLALTTVLGPHWVPWTLWALALFYLVLGIAFSVAVWADPAQGASYFGAVLVVRAAIMHVSRAQAYREGPQNPWTV